MQRRDAELERSWNSQFSISKVATMCWTFCSYLFCFSKYVETQKRRFSSLVHSLRSLNFWSFPPICTLSFYLSVFSLKNWTTYNFVYRQYALQEMSTSCSNIDTSGTHCLLKAFMNLYTSCSSCKAYVWPVSDVQPWFLLLKHRYDSWVSKRVPGLLDRFLQCKWSRAGIKAWTLLNDHHYRTSGWKL